MEFKNSDELNRYVSDISDGTCMLSFSCGKDSICAWLKLRRFFKKIIPVYMQTIPGLSFVEKSIKYYEEFFGTRIIRAPHPSLYRQLNNFTFQAPENLHIIEKMKLPTFDHGKLFEIIRDQVGVAPNTYVSVGVRAADNIFRGVSIRRHGPINEKRKQFYPIYDYNKEMLIREIKNSGVSLPIDYELFGLSYDGIDYRFSSVVKERFPDDYKKILEFFPLVELEILKIKYRREYYEGKKSKKFKNNT